MTVDFANASITLVQKLFEYSAKSEGKRFYFPDEEISLSPIQLLEQVENFAGGFDEWKVPHDSIVLLCGMNSSMIVTAFLATQYGGLIPSIIAPPRRNEINFDERILRLAKVAKPAVILFDESLSEQQLAELKQRELCSKNKSVCQTTCFISIHSIYFWQYFRTSRSHDFT
jgi:acyl-CoA synthetase (AMP-forming)/AMP-acid ligase II